MSKRAGSSGGAGKNVWVGPHPSGAWQVKQEGNKRASYVVPTQTAGLDKGRPLAEQNESDLIIQRPNGQIRERDSHGNESAKPDKK